MLTQKIGITATELFACNPFRVLGVPVDATKAEIDKRYQEFLSAANAGNEASLKTAFDFDSLPPFSRDAKSLQTAYAKLASNGYRCFAYSDSEFTVALNIDDVALNLRDITCYDCFLRCYMWLVINDHDMEEHELWIQLAKYIDKLITSSPDMFEVRFDSRFPREMIDPQKSILRSFYVTFCEIILLPLKEMVRGSMKYDTATDILKLKGIDVNEVFETIDIPQGNLPKPGEPAPKLKLARKDGEEFFDISTGKMVSFSAMNAAKAKIEANEFSHASSAISADAILEEPDEKHAIPEEPVIVPKDNDDTAKKPTHFQAVTPEDSENSAPKLVKRPTAAPIMSIEKPEEKPAPMPAPKPAPVQEQEQQEPTPITPVQLRPRKQSVASTTFESFQQEESQQPQQVRGSAPVSHGPSIEETAQAKDEGKSVVVPALKKKKQTALVDEEAVETPADTDTATVTLTEKKEGEEEEENMYTQALVQMLRANRSRNQFMKDVDTKHVFQNGGGNLSAPAKTADLVMDEINMKTFDKSRLDSPYEMVDRGSPMSRQEKYRNIKIDDMLDPGLNSKGPRISYEPDAIEEFKKHKAQQKKNIKSLIILSIFALGGIGLIVALYFFGII